MITLKLPANFESNVYLEYTSYIVEKKGNTLIATPIGKDGKYKHLLAFYLNGIPALQKR